MPLLDRLEVKNFGCFRHLVLEPGPLTVLVGPNDSGKSTALKAFQALSHLVPEDGYDPRAPLVDQLKMPAPVRVGEEEAEFRASGSRFSLRVTLDSRGRRTLAEFQQQNKFKLIWQPPSVEYWGAAGARESVSGDTDQYFSRSGVQELRALLSDIAAYQLDARELRANADAPTSEAVPPLGERGAGLAATLAVLATAYPAQRDAIDRQFKNAIASLGGFRSLPTAQGGWRLAFPLQNGTGQIEASQVSDGALLFLAFLSILHRPNPPALLLIEEPENGVHPSRLKDIVKLLRKLTEGVDGRPPSQIVMTTHSPYLLDAVRSEDAYFFVREEDGSAFAHRFSDIDKLDERLADYNLGELWTAYGEERLAKLISK